MSDEYVDPSGNTEQFKAFAHGRPENATRSRLPLIVGVVAVAVVVIVLAVLVLG
ncbi:MAG: hypothetical protein QOI74_1736 [Micromonosporaceae bacterium]|jgi:hypothetical protein|nr:hypothetical protein [Micromonosporaceae bacterium]MDT5035269.1 hypothetical protein [Micromonosporaceae bacterium]